MTQRPTPPGLDLNRLPQHVAVIMDGNGRWATRKGSNRIFGHRNAIQAVRDTVEGAAEIGIAYLTLFAFSTENWNRPQAEVNALMRLLVRTLRTELDTLLKNGIHLHAIGNLDDLPHDTRQQLQDAIDTTHRATPASPRMTLTLALSYGARFDILNAVRRLAAAAQVGDLHAENIDFDTFRAHLSTAALPDPELLIRTSGEMRVSNFMLWEIAYAELFISPKLWPDFRRGDLFDAIADYQRRERRFGKTSEQIQAS